MLNCQEKCLTPSVTNNEAFHDDCYIIIFSTACTKYKLGYVKRGSTAFKVPKDRCGVPSAARALLGPEGLLMR